MRTQTKTLKYQPPKKIETVQFFTFLDLVCSNMFSWVVVLFLFLFLFLFLSLSFFLLFFFSFFFLSFFLSLSLSRSFSLSLFLDPPTTKRYRQMYLN